MESLLDLIFEKRTLKRAVTVGIVVGIILNLINQGDALIALDFDNLNLAKLILTFFVPYSVSTYATVKSRLDLRMGSMAPKNAEVVCTTCNKTKKKFSLNDIIPACEICAEGTKWTYTSKN